MTEPANSAPYSFGDEHWEFEDFSALHKIIFISGEASTRLGDGPRELSGELPAKAAAPSLDADMSVPFEIVQDNDRAREHFLWLLNNLVGDGRGLFTLADGLLGSGPPEIEIGDEV